MRYFAYVGHGISSPHEAVLDVLWAFGVCSNVPITVLAAGGEWAGSTLFAVDIPGGWRMEERMATLVSRSGGRARTHLHVAGDEGGETSRWALYKSKSKRAIHRHGGLLR